MIRITLERKALNANATPKDKKGCKGSVSTNLDVTPVPRHSSHMEACPVDPQLAYKMEKWRFQKSEARKKRNPSSSYTTRKPPPPLLSHQHLAIFWFLNGTCKSLTHSGQRRPVKIFYCGSVRQSIS
ncbi:conserved hypothetical protein [Trichinella spiralis]|uniref:hypothetical protein n=1 Tax=Trichinella spiralis TaxID=6334 RepID=UPI0001EFCD83|nr:conserved hypothetical protein [Trichinella spiralis]